MFIKINNKYGNIYKFGYLYKFELVSCPEPDECYLAINENLQYVRHYDGEEIPFNIPQNKIRRQIKKLQNNIF